MRSPSLLGLAAALASLAQALQVHDARASARTDGVDICKLAENGLALNLSGTRLEEPMLHVGWVPGSHTKMDAVRQKLEKNEGVNILVFGGSFTRGHGCSEHGEDELACAWPKRLEEALRRELPAAGVHVFNRAEHGVSTVELAASLSSIVSGFGQDVDLDLVVLDFLVNDLGGGPEDTVRHEPALEAIIRGLTQLLPNSQLVLVEDGCPKCVDAAASRQARLDIGQHYGIPIFDYASMVQRFNHDSLSSRDILWPFSEPEYDGPYTRDGSAWPNFDPPTTVTSSTCCAENHPPWPVHENYARGLRFGFFQMLQQSCSDELGGHGEWKQPAPFLPQATLDSIPICLEPLASFFAKTATSTAAGPTVMSGDWKLFEDVPDRPGWIATAPRSVIRFPVRFGSLSAQLSVSFLRSYENIGDALIRLIGNDGEKLTEGYLFGKTEEHVSLAHTLWFSTREDCQDCGSAGFFLRQYEEAMFIEIENLDSKFKLLSVASC